MKLVYNRIYLFSYGRFCLNTLKLFGPYQAKGKLVQLYFYEKGERVQLSLANIISNGLIQAMRNNIVAIKTTELFLLFHKNITKLVFLCPNMGQKSIKVLSQSFFKENYIWQYFLKYKKNKYFYNFQIQKNFFTQCY